MIQCYYGNGKGKTTAAVGQALRMAGADKKVLFLQFLKDGDSSEIKMLKKCGIKVVSRLEDELFEQIDESYEGIVLDEILDAIALNLLNEGKVYDCLVSLKETHEVILTGRQPSHKLKPILDYSSEIKKHKHPYDKGIKARKGIEF